ncbi:methyl-accepting chemotaxis protein, partial [Franzmannia pantelleriensis]
QENAAMVEESTSAAEQLKDQAGRLNDTVGVFTLSASTATPALSYTGSAPRGQAKELAHAG